MYLRVLDGSERVRLVHAQHAAISLEPGIYQVIRQREYSPEAVRRVVD